MNYFAGVLILLEYNIIFIEQAAKSVIVCC